MKISNLDKNKEIEYNDKCLKAENNKSRSRGSPQIPKIWD